MANGAPGSARSPTFSYKLSNRDGTTDYVELRATTSRFWAATMIMLVSCAIIAVVRSAATLLASIWQHRTVVDV